MKQVILYSKAHPDTEQYSSDDDDGEDAAAGTTSGRRREIKLKEEELAQLKKQSSIDGV